MGDFAPPLAPGTYGAEHRNGPGVTISKRQNLHILHLAGNLRDADFPTAARGALGLPLPQLAGETRDGHGVRILWLAPNRWLVVSGHKLETDAFGEKAAVNDVGQGRSVLRRSGRNVRDVLCKGCPIDLDPQSFSAGHVAATLLGHLNVVIDCITDDVFDLYVTRSYDHFAQDWLVRAGKEFGVSISTS